MASRFFGVKEVVSVSGLSRTTIYRLEKSGKFPARYRLSPGRVGWLESDIDQWIRSRARLQSQ